MCSVAVDPKKRSRSPAPAAPAPAVPDPAVPDPAAPDQKRHCPEASWEEVLTFCPITRDLMVDPAITDDGFTYERAAITEWMSSNGRKSPMNRDMTISHVIPNRAVQAATDSAIASGVVPKEEVELFHARKAEWLFKSGRFHEAAVLGSEKAQLAVSELYENEQNHRAAIKWASKSAENGSAQGAFRLGRLLMGYGRASRFSAPCMSMLEKAASAGIEHSMALLSACYFDDGLFTRARYWCEQSSTTITNLVKGALHYHGVGGYGVNRRMAFFLFIQLLNEPCPIKEIYQAAQVRVALMLLTGDGCDQDIDTGARLMQRCKNNGGRYFDGVLSHLRNDLAKYI